MSWRVNVPYESTGPPPNGEPVGDAVGDAGHYGQGREPDKRGLVAAHPIVGRVEGRAREREHAYAKAPSIRELVDVLVAHDGEKAPLIAAVGAGHRSV